MTTKQLAFRQVVGELLGFIRGYESAKAFRDLGCTIWDANANENSAWLNNPNRKGFDDLGRIYGAQWRNYRGMDRNFEGCSVDQLKGAIREILENPTSRRIIVDAWNPNEIDQMALPPCHILHQYHVDPDTGGLSMTMYQRSCDLFLGVPFNIASYALLLHLVAQVTGLHADNLTMFLADTHIYDNHLEQVKTQLSREPFPLPTLGLRAGRLGVDDNSTTANKVARAMLQLEQLLPQDIDLLNYGHHPAIKAPMAV
jgi:thymidylate synthase